MLLWSIQCSASDGKEQNQHTNNRLEEDINTTAKGDSWFA
jgi:hypothetical protein